jgi:hypothetical protein
MGEFCGASAHYGQDISEHFSPAGHAGVPREVWAYPGCKPLWNQSFAGYNFGGTIGFNKPGTSEQGAQQENAERIRNLPLGTGEVMAMKIQRWLPLAAALVLGPLVLPPASQAQVAVGISVRIGPPPLPVYVQPPCPVAGYMWIPGYWAYGPDGYYWVPGTWVPAPAPGLLWTPGYWGWGNGVYIWHAGYWGPHVGFYGGINYGFGYNGVGFYGGYWRSGRYYYNRSVTNVNVTIIHNTYNERVVNREVTRVSYNGGRGGIMMRPSSEQLAAERERRFGPTAMQTEHRDAAGRDRGMWASQNHGRPSIAATPRAGEFHGRGNEGGNNGRMNENRPPESYHGQENRPAYHNDRPPNARNESRSYGNQPGQEHNNVQHAEHPNNSYQNHPGQEHNNMQRSEHPNNSYQNHPGQEHNNMQNAEHPHGNEHQNGPKPNEKPKPEHNHGEPHHR